jgi:hypothetical protein
VFVPYGSLMYLLYNGQGGLTSTVLGEFLDTL